MWIYIVLLWCNLGTAAAADLKKVQLSGYGASFPSAVYNDWIATFKDMRRTHIDLDMTYHQTGSTKGVRYITGQTDAAFTWRVVYVKVTSHPFHIPSTLTSFNNS